MSTLRPAYRALLEEKKGGAHATKELWIQAALMAMADGLDAVAVERLAPSLGLTKGSFYWHFKSKAALIDAALELWRDWGTDDLIAQLDMLSDPAERLAELIAISWDEPVLLRVEATLMAAAAARHPGIRPVYEQVNARRLKYVQALYRGLGLSAADARRWAVTLYSAYLGTLQLVVLGSLKTKRELRAHVGHLREQFIPRHLRGQRRPLKCARRFATTESHGFALGVLADRAVARPPPRRPALDARRHLARRHDRTDRRGADVPQARFPAALLAVR